MTMPPESPFNCGNCIFGVVLDEAPLVLCRRFPPVPRAINNEDVEGLPEGVSRAGVMKLLSAWPVTAVNDLCGEHTSRPARRDWFAWLRS